MYLNIPKCMSVGAACDLSYFLRFHSLSSIWTDVVTLSGCLQTLKESPDGCFPVTNFHLLCCPVTLNRGAKFSLTSSLTVHSFPIPTASSVTP